MPDPSQDSLTLVLYRLNSIESDIREIKTSVKDLETLITLKESESKERDAAIRTAQDQLQIKVLIFILTTILGIVISLFISYVLHAH